MCSLERGGSTDSSSGERNGAHAASRWMGRGKGSSARLSSAQSKERPGWIRASGEGPRWCHPVELATGHGASQSPAGIHRKVEAWIRVEEDGEEAGRLDGEGRGWRG